MNILSRLHAVMFPVPTHADAASAELEAARIELLATETALEMWAAKREACAKRVRRLEQYVQVHPVALKSRKAVVRPLDAAAQNGMLINSL